MKQLNQSDLPSGVNLDGLSFEMAFDVQGKLLVVSTQDVPHEEVLYFHLYDSDTKLCDSMELYEPYSSGLFKLHCAYESQLDFSFWGESPLRLVLVDPPRRVWIRPEGVHYPKRLSSHYLVIEKLNS